MEFNFKLFRATDNIRLCFEASELVSTDNDQHIRRCVRLECDVIEHVGQSYDERQSNIHEVFRSIHDGCVSMLNAAIGEAVPDSHERASPARKQALAERLAKKRAERLARENEREENKRLAREAFESVSMQEQSCEACIDLKRNHGLNAPSCETHEAIRQTIRDEFVKGGDDEVW